MAEVTVCAAYYASDGASWIREGDELNEVALYRDPPTIVCTGEDGRRLFSCELWADLEYQQPSSQFHQWASENGDAYGLSFPSVGEAEQLAKGVERVLLGLQHPETAGGASPDDPVPLGLPSPQKFPITRRECVSTDEAWRQAETQLRITYPARLRQGLQVQGVTELVREAHLREFESRYREFAMADLWLAASDVSAERVSREGLQALGASMLGLGVPLGIYLLDREELGQAAARQMVLCRVVLARSLPISEDAIGSVREASGLPVGYHSYAVTPSAESETSDDLPTGLFEHLYLLPQPHLVLMTHSVRFQVNTDLEPHLHPRIETPAMSLLAAHPEVLSAADRETIFAVCSPQSKQATAGMRTERDLSHVVDLSYQAMWDELNALTATQKELELNIKEFKGSVDQFKSASWLCVQRLQDEMVSYLGHSGQVLQVFRDRKFEVNRALSDVARFQELFMFHQHTCTTPELLCCWRHLNVMWDRLADEIERLTMRPEVDPKMMTLTESNKKMISLQRKVSLQDELIARVSEKLSERGILLPEDLNIVADI